jgi:predicted porin
MKKQLIGTTALVSAGLLAGAATNQGALAADPLALSIGGYWQTSLELRDEDDSSGEPGANLQSFQINNDGEIQFTASTTLDNGISVKARIEYEATNQGGGQSNPGSAGSVADEHWVEFGGAFGQLRIGSDDDAAYAMQYQAPVGAYQMGVNTTTFAVPAVGGNRIGSYPTTYIATNSDAEKIIYFSPRIAGFQLGLSYAPDGTANDRSAETSGFAGLPKLDNEPGESEDTISIGLNYVDNIGGVDLAVAGGYNTASEESSAGPNSDDREQWSAGLNVGFSGFTVGGSFAADNRGTDSDGDRTTWDAGVTYSNGPLTVGFTYLYSEQELGTTAASASGDDELDSFNVSATYNLGPGVDIWGGVKYYDYQSDTGNSANENEGYIVALGSSVSF